jgi:glycosyltransferase involved in cell wall biosynthesis
MKVAFIFMHPFSESMGSVVRVKELALSLGKSGVEVYIFTPYERSFDLFPHVHVVSASSLVNTLGLSKTMYKLSKSLYYNKVFPRLFSKTEFQSNRVMAKLIKGMAKLLVKKGIDLIQVEQDAVLPLGVGLKKETGLPLIVDVHNVSSEELVAANVLERESNEFVAFQSTTKHLLSQADHVVVVSHSMQDYVVRNFGLSSVGVSVVPPGGRIKIDKAAIEKRDKPAKVVYAGLVAYRERVDLFVKSMPFVQRCNRDVQFFITNKGEAVKKIKTLANRLGVKPEFFWYDSYEEVNSFLSSCHTGVLFSSDNAARQMGTPAKLFNYMSVGLPIVVNANGGWTEIVEKERVGLLTSDDPRDFGETISSLISSPKLMREFAFNGLDLVLRKYNWDISAGILLKAYENLTD